MKLMLKGSESLSQIAKLVEPGTDVSELIAGMWEIMNKGDGKDSGIGLAANQVGDLRRVIVVNAQGFKAAIINPVIVKRYNGKVKGTEGCLSFPGLTRVIERDKRVLVTGFDPSWKPIRQKLYGLAAVCVQHEVDHLNGITIGDEL